MKENKPTFLKDLRPQIFSIDTIRERHQLEIEKASVQLAEIAPSLQDLVKQILEQKPDMVVFLDKGARILATPMAEYLREKTDHMPEIRFYNDEILKLSFHSTTKQDKDFKVLFQSTVDTDFALYKGKKVFFIDETFSAGKAVSALATAIKSSGVDGYYFALTEDPQPADADMWNSDPMSRLTYAEVQDIVSDFRATGRMKVYPNKIGYLFTKDAASLYVIDDKDSLKTAPRYAPILEEQSQEEYNYTIKDGELPHGRAFVDDYSNRDWKEYDKQVRSLNQTTIKKLKELVLKTLEGN